MGKRDSSVKIVYESKIQLLVKRRIICVTLNLMCNPNMPPEILSKVLLQGIRKKCPSQKIVFKGYNFPQNIIFGRKSHQLIFIIILSRLVVLSYIVLNYFEIYDRK